MQLDLISVDSCEWTRVHFHGRFCSYICMETSKFLQSSACHSKILSIAKEISFTIACKKKMKERWSEHKLFASTRLIISKIRDSHRTIAIYKRSHGRPSARHRELAEFINESDFQLRIPWQFHLQSILSIYKRDSLKAKLYGFNFLTIFYLFIYLFIDVCICICMLFTEECRSRAFCNISCRQSHIHAPVCRL